MSCGGGLLVFLVPVDAKEFHMEGLPLFLSFLSRGFKWAPVILKQNYMLADLGMTKSDHQ